MLHGQLHRLETEIQDCEARVRLHDARAGHSLHRLRHGAVQAMGGKALLAGGALAGAALGAWWSHSKRRRRVDPHAGYREGFRDGQRAARRRHTSSADFITHWGPLLLPLATPLMNRKVAQFLVKLGVPLAVQPPQTMPTVAQLDLKRYAGRWQEIARLPQADDPDGLRGNEFEFTPDEQGGLSVLQTSRLDDGSTKEVHGHLRRPDGTRPGELELSVAPAALRWWPGSWSDRWVLFVDEDYTVALVGTPDRDGLWILAREPNVGPTDLEALKSLALRHGFDTDRLVLVDRTEAEAPGTP